MTRRMLWQGLPRSPVRFSVVVDSQNVQVQVESWCLSPSLPSHFNHFKISIELNYFSSPDPSQWDDA